MSSSSPTPLSPRTPGTYRGKCSCNFWIVTRAQLNRLRCPACGDLVRHASRQMLADENVVDVVVEPAPEPKRKKKSGPKAPPASGGQMLDDLDAAEARRLKRRFEQEAA